MNERLKELSNQAYSWALVESKEGDNMCREGSDYFLHMVQQKFAELIVLECAEISWKHWMKHKDCSAHFSIREHFGVEE